MMNMQSRNQYLKELRKEYLQIKNKKKKGELLDEAEKRTGLNRKYLMEKLKPRSNLDRQNEDRKKRKVIYDGQVRAVLATCWKIFDYPCGQRLQPLLEQETERLRKQGALHCSDETAEKLRKVSFCTIDELLQHEKEIEYQRRKYQKKVHPLLYQKIPVQVFSEQNRSTLGNVQIDLVEHCGNSAGGEFLNTLSTTDIATGWWEGEAVMGRAQERVHRSVRQARSRYPFPWASVHSDNGTEFINWELFRYCKQGGLSFSRSRPYKKNDNCLVEQKNWTHVKKFVGYLRYDTENEQRILNDLYRNELRLYKNFFQPVMKLVLKERIGGKIHRRYDKPKTPYQRVMESKKISENKKQELKKIYLALNPAQLKRTIDMKLHKLYHAYQKKHVSQMVEPAKKQTPRLVRFFTAQPVPVSVR